MVNKFLKSLSITLTISLSGISYAKDNTIYVLRNAPGGGPHGIQNIEVVKTLEESGYNVELKPFNNCLDAINWHKKNKDKKALLIRYSTDAALNLMPDSTLKCDVRLSEDNFIFTHQKWWWTICGHNNGIHTVDEFLRNGTGRVVMTSEPHLVEAMNYILSSIGTSVSVAPILKATQRVESYNAQDFEYYGNATPNAEKSLLDSTCFLTTATIEEAKEYLPNMTSFQEINPKVPFAGYAFRSFIMGLNFSDDEKEELFNVFNTNGSELFKVFLNERASLPSTRIEQYNELMLEAKDVVNKLNEIR